MQDERVLLHPGDGLVQQVVQRHGLSAARDLAREVREARRARAAPPHRVRRAPVVVQERPVHVDVLRLCRHIEYTC